MTHRHDIEDYTSDAPVSAAVDQKGLQHQVAEANDWDRAAIIGRTVTINKPREALYAFWRDFKNLPAFMHNVRSITLSDDQVSHWEVEKPGGGTVGWDSKIIEDIPGQVIAWESLPGADIKNTGKVEFLDAPGGRGTWVRATIAWEPPGGDLGRLLAKLFLKEPKMQTRQDLRRFKQLMETGEIPTAEALDAAPRA